MEEIIEEMTLEEKVGQLFMSTFESDSVNGEIITLITFYHIGGVLLKLPSKIKRNKIAHMNRYLQYYATNKRPLFIASNQRDVEMDKIEKPYSFLAEDSLYKINNRHYTKQLAEVIAAEYRAIGINTIIYPELTISSHNLKEIRNEVDTVANHGVATVQGIAKSGVISCVTGFPSFDAVDIMINPDGRTSNVFPFYKVINHGLVALKISEPTKSFIHYIRNTLQYNHLIIYELEDNFTSVQEICHDIVHAIHSGVDYIILPYTYKQQLSILNAIIELGKKGEIDVERINEALKRIYKIKEQYQLNDLSFMDGRKLSELYVTSVKESVNEKLTSLT